MFRVDKEDLTIHITRGDTAELRIEAVNTSIDDEKVPYSFKSGDVLRLKVFGKKDCDNVVLQKYLTVEEDTEVAVIPLTYYDTKIGETINKTTDYWYEVELNPLTEPQTIIGNDEDGAKIFKLYPEGADIETIPPPKEEIGAVDSELSETSERAIQNKAVTIAIRSLENRVEEVEQKDRPEKGVDYWTEEDKEEIVETVKGSLPLDEKVDKGEGVEGYYSAPYITGGSVDGKLDVYQDGFNITTFFDLIQYFYYNGEVYTIGVNSGYGVGRTTLCQLYYEGDCTSYYVFNPMEKAFRSVKDSENLQADDIIIVKTIYNPPVDGNPTSVKTCESTQFELVKGVPDFTTYINSIENKFNDLVGDIDTALDSIITIQNGLIGGGDE